MIALRAKNSHCQAFTFLFFVLVVPFNRQVNLHVLIIGHVQTTILHCHSRISRQKSVIILMNCNDDIYAKIIACTLIATHERRTLSIKDVLLQYTPLKLDDFGKKSLLDPSAKINTSQNIRGYS